MESLDFNENENKEVQDLNENEKEKEKENEKEVEDPTSPKIKCVFISGIPYDTTQDQIKEMFDKCGIIKEIKMPKYQDTGRNIELNKTYIGKRYITVSLAQGENTNKRERKADTMEVPVKCSTIFIRNLPYDVTEDEVGDKFRPCGEIKNIRFVYNSSHNHFKGFGYVEFTDRNSVLKALKLNEKPIKGRNMIVDFEDEGPKMGYKNRNENPSKYNKDQSFLRKKKRISHDD